MTTPLERSSRQYPWIQTTWNTGRCSIPSSEQAPCISRDRTARGTETLKQPCVRHASALFVWTAAAEEYR